MPTTLTDTEQEMLALERLWWEYEGAKETEIRERFDMSARRYYLELSRLLDREDALAFDPLVVRRLRRIRERRQLSRPTSQRA